VDTVPSLTGRTFTGGRIDLALLLNVPPPPPASPPPSDRAGPRVLDAVVGGPRIGTFDRAWIQFSEPVDPASLPQAIALQLPGGGTTTVSNVIPVAGKNNTEFTVVFKNRQTTAGTYTLTVSYLAHDRAGNRLDQNANGKNGELTDWYVERATLGTARAAEAVGQISVAADGLPKPVGDRRTTRVEIPVTRDIPVKNLTVFLKLAHGRSGDLSIRLTAPDGRKVTLFNRSGGINLSSATFGDAGPVRPVQSLSQLNGLSARGLWVVEVFDLGGTARGTLSAVSLGFEVPNRSAVQALKFHEAEIAPILPLETAPVREAIRVDDGVTLVGPVAVATEDYQPDPDRPPLPVGAVSLFAIDWPDDWFEELDPVRV
jgi:subtilisin-like proprotein convertase family protein